MNKFGDLSKEEFKRLYTGLQINTNRTRNEVALSTTALPTTSISSAFFTSSNSRSLVSVILLDFHTHFSQSSHSFRQR